MNTAQKIIIIVFSILFIYIVATGSIYCYVGKDKVGNLISYEELKSIKSSQESIGLSFDRGTYCGFHPIKFFIDKLK